MNRPTHPAQHLIDYREKNPGVGALPADTLDNFADAYSELSGRAIGLVRKVGRHYGLERCWEFAALHPGDITALRGVGLDTRTAIMQWLADAGLRTWPLGLPTAARYDDRSARRRLIAERLNAIEQALDLGLAGHEPDDEALETEPEPEPETELDEPKATVPDVPPERIPNRHLYTATHCPVCDRIDLGDTYVVIDGLAVCWECFVNQGFARSLYTLRTQLLEKATA